MLVGSEGKKLYPPANARDLAGAHKQTSSICEQLIHNWQSWALVNGGVYLNFYLLFSCGIQWQEHKRDEYQ